MIKTRNSLLPSLVIPIAALSASGAHAQGQSTTDSFEVSINIEATCAVIAGNDIDLGSQISTATGLSGSSTISVNCSKTVPYNVGLQPSNKSEDGAGVLSGTGSDTIAYQLRSISASGANWGNTATSSDVGNGVSGTGEGSDQTIPVYVTVDDANVAPGSYSDTVTVTVNY